MKASSKLYCSVPQS